MAETLNTLLDRWVNETEPREPNRRQRVLTARFLTPHQDILESFFLDLRDETDRDVAAGARAWTGPKAYPEGFCREIRNDVMARLSRSVAERSIRNPVVDFIRAGGLVKPIWGDLRGAYLQNAIQLGSLYVDVANDTVDVSKPKVEILPLESSGMRPIRRPEHFAQLAARYWKATIYTNTLIPALCPIFPMLLGVDGGLRLAPSQRSLMAHAVREDFRPAEDYVAGRLEAADVLPVVLAEQAAAALRRQGLAPEVGEVRTGVPDRQEIEAAFAAFRSPSGPFRDIAAFTRFAERVRPIERLDLSAEPPAALSPQSQENLERIEVNSAL